MTPAEFVAFTDGAFWRIQQAQDLALLTGWCNQAIARWKGNRFPTLPEALKVLLGRRSEAGSQGARRVHLALRALARSAKRRKVNGQQG